MSITHQQQTEAVSALRSVQLHVKFVSVMKISVRSMSVSLVNNATTGIIKTVCAEQVIRTMQGRARVFRIAVGLLQTPTAVTRIIVLALFLVVGTLQ